MSKKTMIAVCMKGTVHYLDAAQFADGVTEDAGEGDGLTDAERAICSSAEVDLADFVAAKREAGAGSVSESVSESAVNPHGLTAEEVAVCASLRISQEAFAQSKREEAVAAFERGA
jgi:hypothetical protein